jgi:hypothetical protein
MRPVLKDSLLVKRCDVDATSVHALLRRLLLIAGVAAAAGGSGATAVAHASQTTAQRLYAIEMRASKKLLLIGSSQIHHELVVTQQRLAPCAEDVLSATAVQHPSAQMALGRELGAQYADSSLAPALTVLRQKATALAQLPSSTAFRVANRKYLQTLKLLSTLNTCADYTRWAAAGFTPTTEPANTKAAQTAHAPPPAVIVIATATQFRLLKAEANKAQAHYLKFYKEIQESLTPWLQNLPIQAAPTS